MFVRSGQSFAQAAAARLPSDSRLESGAVIQYAAKLVGAVSGDNQRQSEANAVETALKTITVLLESTQPLRSRSLALSQPHATHYDRAICAADSGKPSEEYLKFVPPVLQLVVPRKSTNSTAEV